MNVHTNETRMMDKYSGRLNIVRAERVEQIVVHTPLSELFFTDPKQWLKRILRINK